MILTEYGSISSIVASEKEKENAIAIAIDHHNCICYKCRTFGYFNMVDV